jgi:hypothetical protein
MTRLITEIRRRIGRRIPGAALGGVAVVLVMSVALGAGYCAGRAAGTWSIGNAFAGGYPALFLLNKPSFRFYEAYRLINSTDENLRLRGYYVLFENRIIDAEYLCERLDHETADINRRTIVWMLGYARGRARVFDAFSSRYPSAGPMVRREILRSLQRMGDSYFRDFVEKHSIRGEFLEGL